MADPAYGPSPIPLDNTIANAIALKSQTGREVVNVGSYVTMGTNDALIAWHDGYEKAIKSGDGRGAIGAFVIDGLAFGVSEGLYFGSKFALEGTPFSWRPMDKDCAVNPNYDAFCGTSEEQGGDPSGHAWNSWTPVGILLAHRLWDHENPTSDSELALSFGLGAATMLQRMLGNYHYLSQVVTGAVGGLASGVAIPGIAQAVGLGYDHWNRQGSKPPSYTLSPTVEPTAKGLSVGLVVRF